MSLNSARDADDPLRRARRQTLSTIHKQTGDPQPVGIAVQHLYLTVVNHGPIGHEHARKARDAALEQGLLVEYEGADGTTRYGLTEAGVDAVEGAAMPIYSPADESALRDIIDREVSKPDGDVDGDVIGWANTHLLSLPEADDE